MKEENMKNYSIRLGSEEIKRLDGLTRKHSYWKRSFIIRAVLLGVFQAMSDYEIYNLIRFALGAKYLKVTITIEDK